MKIRDLLLWLISETDLDDRVTFFDIENDGYRDFSIKKLGTTVYFEIYDKEKSDIEIREDFFK